ncbi:hypothetical protein Acr_17g0005780 [Actinidia rufa]|uniref:Uncharacterized protein n=1 Tax=Actinidia rufa TaxID=165716 RepID=A0A7J0G2J7_9ERIC|nr:hypothetical protein Acr_17g0005780 [Actinidia rufa]
MGTASTACRRGNSKASTTRRSSGNAARAALPSQGQQALQGQHHHRRGQQARLQHLGFEPPLDRCCKITWL